MPSQGGSRAKRSERDNWEGDKKGYPRDKDGWTTMPTDPAERMVPGGTAKDMRKKRGLPPK